MLPARRNTSLIVTRDDQFIEKEHSVVADTQLICDDVIGFPSKYAASENDSLPDVGWTSVLEVSSAMLSNTLALTIQVMVRRREMIKMVCQRWPSLVGILLVCIVLGFNYNKFQK